MQPLFVTFGFVSVENSHSNTHGDTLGQLSFSIMYYRPRRGDYCGTCGALLATTLTSRENSSSWLSIEPSLGACCQVLVESWYLLGTYGTLQEHFRNTSVFPKLRHAPIRLQFTDNFRLSCFLCVILSFCACHVGTTCKLIMRLAAHSNAAMRSLGALPPSSVSFAWIGPYPLVY